MKLPVLFRSAIVGAAIVVLTVPLVSASASATDGGASSVPLVVELDTGSVEEANGVSVSPGAPAAAAAEGETIENVVTADGSPAVVTRRFALPVSESTLVQHRSAIDADALEAASRYPDVLPAEMIPFEYSSSAEAIVVEGSTESVLIDPAEMELTSITAVTPTTVSHAWRGAGEYHSIFRDGELVTTVRSTSFTDAELESTSSYVYEIESHDSTGAIVGSQFIPIRTPGGTLDASVVAPLTYQNYNSQAVYRTFIADARVTLDFAATWGCGQQFQPDRSFGGDNRGFIVPPFNAPWDSTSSRTSFFLSVNWDNPAPHGLAWVKEVSPTRLYQGNTLIETRTASDAGIVISEAYSTGSYAQARVAHDVGNPFCVAGSIQYNVVFRYYRSGTFEVVGWRQPVPHHEIYGGWDGGSGYMHWRAFGQFTNEGFGCLVGSCGTRSINVTKTY